MFHVFGFTHALSREAHQLAASVDDTLGLGHTTLRVIRIDRTHRLDTDGIITTDPDLANTGLC